MTETTTAEESKTSVYRSYIMNVRIVEVGSNEVTYRFEAPQHQGIEFEDPDTATLYADVYFDVNGFEEAGTGERGVPPIIIQAGRDTLAAYFLTQPYTDEHWVGSFMGVKPGKVERYVSRVRKRATNIRAQAQEYDDEIAATER